MARVSDTPMVCSTARIVTDRPERYIKQLVSHLGRRLTTQVGDDGLGTIDFPQGQCLLRRQEGYIDVRASAVDSVTLATVEGVVRRHLERFASAGELTVAWTPASGDTVGG